MNYIQTLDYLFSQLPMFHRVGAAAYKANLDNTISLCRILGDPENKFPSIHIAGTNGKGSVSHLIASVLQEAGYKTGLYTSPHLKDFRERIRINGKKIPKSNVTGFVKKYKAFFEPVQPSFFEYTFGLAVEYFANENVDIAVMETGMGGRLDSTNVVRSILSVITNIGLDHTQFLGETLEEIAIEKAGIIKPGIPVVIGETHEMTRNVFLETSVKYNAPSYFADTSFKVKESGLKKLNSGHRTMDVYKDNQLFYRNIQCPLMGNYQQKNLATVFQITDILIRLGFQIQSSHLRDGIRNVIHNTGLMGRWQVLGHEPLIIADTGHNFDGITEVVKQLRETPHKKLHFVLGLVKDKNIGSIIEILPKEAVYYLCKADIPRGLDQDELRNVCLVTGLSGNSFNSVRFAFEAAKAAADPKDLIFIGGSTFVVAEVI
jgi:dihydrofolate synthase / folylpolyglutamate synthase